MKPYRMQPSKRQKRALRIRTGVGQRYRVSPQRQGRESARVAHMVKALAEFSTALAGFSAAMSNLVMRRLTAPRFGIERPEGRPVGDVDLLTPDEYRRRHMSGIIRPEDHDPSEFAFRIERNPAHLLSHEATAELRAALDKARGRLHGARAGSVVLIADKPKS